MIRRYKRDGDYYKRNETPLKFNSKEYRKKILLQMVEESYNIVEFACSRWMKMFKQSRSTFFRLWREIKK